MIQKAIICHVRHKRIAYIYIYIDIYTYIYMGNSTVTDMTNDSFLYHSKPLLSQK